MRKLIKALKDRKERYLAKKVLQVMGGVYDPSIFKAVFLAGGAGCFDSNTLVHTEKGLKKIASISIGEKVWTLSKDGKKELNLVDDIFKFDANKSMIELELENNEIIICTTDHEFKLKNGDWKKASDLTEEDDLLCF